MPVRQSLRRCRLAKAQFILALATDDSTPWTQFAVYSNGNSKPVRRCRSSGDMRAETTTLHRPRTTVGWWCLVQVMETSTQFRRRTANNGGTRKRAGVLDPLRPSALGEFSSDRWTAASIASTSSQADNSGTTRRRERHLTRLILD